MSDRIFFDTNILVYAHTDVNISKQSVAQDLIVSSTSFVSTQVIQELANTLFRKFKQPWKDVKRVLEDSIENNALHQNSERTIMNACRVAESYQFSFYDSLILSAALECNCNLLYSEDLNSGQIIEKRLTIVNPFSK